ncbi:signal recognition particle-docking protein FtsY [Estrella lausannensis]|uniref:Signal recognition particle receptor FtsY n=1 Tax=Estrella lausannensis TaxID=483423 RepID=A0A0H5E757_9BACT|nr:signal recognition particle-docking protein FtsY [Estrella lausannensis]CRX39150.1 Cell division protein FtsY [Estrella lausannensis]
MVLNFLKAGYEKVKEVLSRGQAFLGLKLRELFGKPISEETLDEIEKVLYEADIGPSLAGSLTELVRKEHIRNPQATPDDYLNLIKKAVTALLGASSSSFKESADPTLPTVILVVGINGSGKTTTIAKLSHYLKSQGKTVMLGACDTFRAAAQEQLDIWAERTGVSIVKGKPGSDPAAVAFDAYQAAKSRGCQYLIIDTAGRLQNKTHLMQELEKIKRILGKNAAEAPHETLLVIDANLGQNGIDQARVFHQFTPLTGIVLTKLDGSAKGGIVLAARQEIGVPVKFIGVGEGMDDLKPFDPESFAEALLGQ